MPSNPYITLRQTCKGGMWWGDSQSDRTVILQELRLLQPFESNELEAVVSKAHEHGYEVEMLPCTD